MKQKDIDDLMKKIDRRCKLPKYWNKFIDDNSEKHHLIIKNKGQKNLYCTNCNKEFINKGVKVRDNIECPHCHKKSFVYGMNYYRTSFEQSIVLVQRVDKQIVIRVFEIYSYFEQDSKQIYRSCVEYFRILPGIGKFMGSNVFINMYGLMRVYHNYKELSWSIYRGNKTFYGCPTYPYSKSKLIKGTIMEYAPINEFLDRFSYLGYRFLDVLELAAYGSFELLWKMKLYNLSFYSKALNKSGSFFKRFGVPKYFLKYMQDKNVTYKELMMLRLLKTDDDKVISKYIYYNFNHIRFLKKNDILDEFFDSNNQISAENIRLLKELSEYIPIKKLKNYPKGLNNLNIYVDYLEMAKKLALNYRSKKDLFPRNLIARHDKLQEKIRVDNDFKTQQGGYLRYLELSKYTYKNDKYIIFPAPSIDSMKEEGKQQQNCVGYMYLDSYTNGTTEIFFIRKLEDVCESFITLEYKNGEVKQKELKNHGRNFTDEQEAFINEWLGFRSFIDKKERVKNRLKIKVKKYNLKQLVA